MGARAGFLLSFLLIMDPKHWDHGNPEYSLIAKQAPYMILSMLNSDARKGGADEVSRILFTNSQRPQKTTIKDNGR